MNLNNLQSWAVSVARGGRGMYVSSRAARQPEKTLELYEFENCPFCRKVREVLTELDLEYISHPTPKGASRNRAALVAAGGKEMVPYLVDPNTGRSMYESEEIIDYLMQTYGTGRSALGRGLRGLNTATSALASGLRFRGGKRRGAADRQPPPQRLELYNFEASPYCRKAREALCELELDSVVHNVGKSGRRRRELVERGGKMQVPYLIDPNTGAEMYESEEIVAYLLRTYG